MKGLGRIPHHDPRNMRFAASAIIDPDKPLKSRDWECNLLLDQKTHSSCVGCAWTYELAARPAPVRNLDYRFALYQIYFHATDLDIWSDNDRDPYAGTSTLAGAQACQARGYFREYRWASSVEEIARLIAYSGPVVLGLPWYSSMDRINSDGFLTIGGSVVGGHDILAKGVNVEGSRFFTLKQSWGKGKWEMGGTGDCRISWDDLEKLFHQNGEACFPVRRMPHRLRPVYLPNYPR